MKQPNFFGVHAPLELPVEISSRLEKYGMQPKFDDNDRLRAYLVIMDLEKKAKDKSGWLVGFLICASIWSFQANGWPFVWISEIFGFLGWSRDAIFFCNLMLLIMFWIAVFLLVDTERQTRSWQVSDEELGDLTKRIREIRRAQEPRGL